MLKDRIYFANGLVLSPDEDFIVVAETGTSTLHRYWLKGEKSGQSEVFIDGLPGSPDNLMTNERGILISLPVAIDKNHPALEHILCSYPTIRKFLLRLIELLLMPFRFINSFYPNYFTNTFSREFGGMGQLKFLFPSRKTVVLVDWEGNILEAYHGSDGSLGTTTHALQRGDFLYLGTVTENFIGRVQLKEN